MAAVVCSCPLIYMRADGYIHHVSLACISADSLSMTVVSYVMCFLLQVAELRFVKLKMSEHRV